LQKRHGLCKKKSCSKHDEKRIKKKKGEKIAHVQKEEKKERYGIIQKESIHPFHPYTITIHHILI
jgi:hypothetical protein